MTSRNLLLYTSSNLFFKKPISIMDWRSLWNSSINVKKKAYKRNSQFWAHISFLDLTSSFCWYSSLISSLVAMALWSFCCATLGSTYFLEKPSTDCNFLFCFCSFFKLYLKLLVSTSNKAFSSTNRNLSTPTLDWFLITCEKQNYIVAEYIKFSWYL